MEFAGQAIPAKAISTVKSPSTHRSGMPSQSDWLNESESISAWSSKTREQLLGRSDFPVERALELLTRLNLDATLIVPTPNGLDKSILDATEEVRTYLAEKGFHDYSQQRQGPADKVVREAFFVQPGALEATRVSLYRPVTKNGDPRIDLTLIER